MHRSCHNRSVEICIKPQNFHWTWNILVLVFLNCSCEINFGATLRCRKGCVIRIEIFHSHSLFFWHGKKTKKSTNNQVRWQFRGWTQNSTLWSWHDLRISVIIFITYSINFLRFGASSPPIIFPLGLASIVRNVSDIAKVKRNTVFILTSMMVCIPSLYRLIILLYYLAIALLIPSDPTGIPSIGRVFYQVNVHNYENVPTLIHSGMLIC